MGKAISFLTIISLLFMSTPVFAQNKPSKETIVLKQVKKGSRPGLPSNNFIMAMFDVEQLTFELSDDIMYCTVTIENNGNSFTEIVDSNSPCINIAGIQGEVHISCVTDGYQFFEGWTYI